jgi:hypothetical protein
MPNLVSHVFKIILRGALYRHAHGRTACAVVWPVQFRFNRQRYRWPRVHAARSADGLVGHAHPSGWRYAHTRSHQSMLSRVSTLEAALGSHGQLWA